MNYSAWHTSATAGRDSQLSNGMCSMYRTSWKLITLEQIIFKNMIESIEVKKQAAANGS